MGKLVYSWVIQRDKTIPDTLVRSSTIPEELGRIEYLFSDKTGTLTKNEMVFRKLQLGAVSYGQESMSEVRRKMGLYASFLLLMSYCFSPASHLYCEHTPILYLIST